MNSTQKRIVVILTVVTVLVFVAVLIASLAPPDEESDEASVTTTTTTTSQPPATTATTPDDTTTTETATTSTTTTTTTSTTTTSTTTTTTVLENPLVLRGDGLGSVALGDEAESAVEALAALLGTPDDDSGWIPALSGFGTCPGDQVRGVRWATLWVLMTDGTTEWRNDGVPHFFSYLNSVFYDESQSLGLTTEEGIALGDRLDALRAAYGEDVVVTFDDFADGYIYAITVPSPGRLGGGLTGDLDEDLITSIDGGSGCGE